MASSDISEEKAQKFAALVPPESIERIVLFFTELSERIGASGLADGEADTVGRTGRSAAAFAENLAAGHENATPTLSYWFTTLMTRYQVQVTDIPEFSFWLAKWFEISQEPDSGPLLGAPRSFLAAATSPALLRQAAIPTFAIATSLAAQPTMAATGIATPAAALTQPPTLGMALAASQAPEKLLVRPTLVSPDTNALSAQPSITSSFTGISSGRVSPPQTSTASTTPEPSGGGNYSEQRSAWQESRREGRASTAALRPRRADRPALSQSPNPTETLSPDGLAKEPSLDTATAGPTLSRSTTQSLSESVSKKIWGANLGMAGLAAPWMAQSAQASNVIPDSQGVMPGGSDVFHPASFGSSTPPFAAGNLPLVASPGQAPMVPTQSFAAVSDRAPVTPSFLSPNAPGAAISGFGSAGMALVSAISTHQSVTTPEAFNSQGNTTPPAPPMTPHTPELLATSKFAAMPSVTSALVPVTPNLPSLVPSAAGNPKSALPLASGIQTAAFAEKIASQSHQPLASRNLLAGSGPGGVPTLSAASHLGMPLAGGPIPQASPIISPEMGQITLVAPPLHVASPEAEQAGMATAFDWPTLAKGAGVLDSGGLARLQSVLPEGAEAIYPALPPGSAGKSAINLPLAPSLLSSLLGQAYGPAAPGIATQAAGMADAATGGAAPAAPLNARLVPAKRPMGGQAGLVHSDATQKSGPSGALGEAGRGQATRGGVLDFLGMPVRLAPSLGGKPELADEVAVRGGAGGSPHTVRPNDFVGLRSKLFPSFHSIHAEPDKRAWEQAAPHFGLRDGKPTTLLAPDARVPLSHSASALLPQANKGGASGPLAGHNPFLPSLRPGFGHSGSVGHFSKSSNVEGGIHGGHPVTGGALPHSFQASYSPLTSWPGGRAPQSSSFGYSGVSMPPLAHHPSFGNANPGVTHSAAPFTFQAPTTPSLGVPWTQPESVRSSLPDGMLSPTMPSYAVPWTQPSFAFSPPSFSPRGAPTMGGLGSHSHTHFGSRSTPFRLPSSPAYANPSGGSYSPTITGQSFSHGLFPKTAHEHASSGNRGGFSMSTPSFTAGPKFPRSFSNRAAPEPAGATLFVWPSASPGRPILPNQGSSYSVSPRAIPTLLQQTSTFAPMQSSAPSHSFASTPSHTPSVLWERAPTRNYMLPPTKPHARTAPDTMTIQRVTTGGNAAMQTTSQSPTQAHRQASQSAHDKGKASSEVNLLANEVWSLLKGRLSAEADRRGRW